MSWVPLAALLFAGCVRGPEEFEEETEGTPAPTGDTTPAPMTPPTTTPMGNAPPSAPAAPRPFDWNTISSAQAETYLGKIAPTVLGRVLTAAERQQIKDRKGPAIEPIVAAWVKEGGFIESVRLFMEQSLNTSGKAPITDAAGKTVEVDFGLPGNLAAYLVKNDRPWSEIITSQACYDRAGKAIACDTSAPYSAGLLTTRAFMISRASRFNLTRSSAIMRNFACRGYPQEDSLQPRIEKPALIPMFQAETPEEQTDDRARAGFGNGFGCYTCHGQFAVHAQLFVKFDRNGLWQTTATGLQDPKGELGRSVNGLMASHLKDAARAKLETSQMFGKPVENLAEAAKVMVQSPTFLQCAAHRYLDHVLGLNYGTVEYDNALLAGIAQRAKAGGPDPSFGKLTVALLTDPLVVTSIVKSVMGGSP